MDHDFIVMGGGVAGLSAGAALSALGKVLVLEREARLGYHASGRSAALLVEGYGGPLTLELNRAAKAAHFALMGGSLRQRGMLLVATGDEEDRFRAEAEGMQALSVAEARARVPILDPDRVALAAFSAEAWDLDTDAILQHYARQIRAAGSEIRLRTEVTAVARIANGWRVTTGAGDVAGAVLVNAAGAWADMTAALAGIAPLGLTPRRRSMAQLPAPGGHDVTGWPLVMGVDEAWYCKPEAGKLLVSPADADPVAPQDAWPDDMVLAEGLDRYQQMMAEPVTRVETSWAGLRTFAPDGELVIGPEPADPAFLWVAGQGGYGFQTAPAAGPLLADLAAGRGTGFDDATQRGLSPARFR